MGSSHEESPRAVGVVGDGPLAGRVCEAVEAGGAELVRGSAAEATAADPGSVVAVGEAALLDLVRADVGAPVLPVDAGPGYGGVAAGDAAAGVESLLGGDFERDTRDVLAASVDGDPAGRALADVMLVTAEPARISEYAVRSRGEQVARVRADGLVVSTPTGSHGYGRTAGGPILEPGSGVVGVLPVAPFAVNADHWVVSTDRPVTLSVERDESEVSLLLDDRTVRSVAPHVPVEVARDGALAVARVPESRPFFER
ncbi:hypothetical protein [Halorussus sp. GCM10023401]|uniref:hypothetical protein n=1 Tax=Halorussus sp. GCM10023401 TaxID=3252680 RepID=UPI003615B1F5